MRIRLRSEHLNALLEKIIEVPVYEKCWKKPVLEKQCGSVPVPISNPKSQIWYEDGRKMRVCCSAISSLLLACPPFPRGINCPNSVGSKFSLSLTKPQTPAKNTMCMWKTGSKRGKSHCRWTGSVKSSVQALSWLLEELPNYMQGRDFTSDVVIPSVWSN